MIKVLAALVAAGEVEVPTTATEITAAVNTQNWI